MIGIDIGTTCCMVAYVDPTGKPNIIPNSRGEHTTPSVIYLQDSAEPLIGTDAVEQGFLDPTNCVRNFKPKLGSTESLLNSGRSFTPTDATAILIGRIKKDAEATLNREVTEVVATCPANCKDDAKQALLDAFEQNGIKVLKLIPEPTGAGIAYALEKQGSTITFLVYDFGGGTFDVSIVRIDGAQVSVLATEGVPQLGGNDINKCIENRLLDEIEAKFGKRPTPQDDPLFFHDISTRIEAVKISLGSRKEVPIVAAYNGGQVVVKLTQEWFHKAIEHLIQQSLEAVNRAVGAAGLAMSQINSLVMVGGTSRLSCIQDAVANATSLYPKTDIDPSKAIAYGGALACIAEMARDGRTATIGGQVIPAPDMFVRDVTAHAVGCCVVDSSGPNRRMIHSVIIPKNTPIPCQKTDRFFLEHDQQTAAKIEILQGKPNADRDDCLLIGELDLDNLPSEPQRTQRIGVEYIIDANGMVTATATDKVSGKTQTVSVDYKKGVKPKDKPQAA